MGQRFGLMIAQALNLSCLRSLVTLASGGLTATAEEVDKELTGAGDDWGWLGGDG